MKAFFIILLVTLVLECYSAPTEYQSEQSGYEQMPDDNSVPMSADGGDQQAYNSDGNAQPKNDEPSGDDEEGSDDSGSANDAPAPAIEGEKSTIDDNTVADDTAGDDVADDVADDGVAGMKTYPSGYENKPESPSPPVSSEGGDQLAYQKESNKFRFTR